MHSQNSQSMTTTVLLFVILAFPLMFLFLLHRSHRKNGGLLHLPPVPPGLPFIGNLHQMDNSAPHRHFWKLSKQYGPLMSLRLGSVFTVVVSSARIAKEVMKTHDLQFCSGPSWTGPQRLSYKYVDLAFSPYNDYWREMRKVCVLHLFSSGRVHSHKPIREFEVSRMIQKFSKFASASEPINLSERMIPLTNTITCRVAFGRRYEDEGCQKSKFHIFLNDAQAALGGMFFSDYFPLVGWMDKLTGLTARLEKTFREMDSLFPEIIEEHLKPDRSKGQDQHKDIIDVLIELVKDNDSFAIDITYEHIKAVLMLLISLMNIKAVLMNIFLGGTDTGAATVIWGMTELMKNPRVMKKAQEEVRNTFGKKRFIGEDDVQKLTYMKAVIKETLRLLPVAPLLVPRETLQKCSIDGYDIPPKSVVYVNAWAIGRDPEFWENPEEFLPERFLGSSVDFRGQHYQLIPFGAGRRICPGMNMGVARVELILANLLYSFDWEMPPGVKEEDIDFDVIPGVTMHKKNALWLVAKNQPS